MSPDDSPRKMPTRCGTALTSTSTQSCTDAPSGEELGGEQASPMNASTQSDTRYFSPLSVGHGKSHSHAHLQEDREIQSSCLSRSEEHWMSRKQSLLQPVQKQRCERQHDLRGSGHAANKWPRQNPNPGLLISKIQVLN